MGTCDFLKLQLVLKKAVTNKWLNGNTDEIRDIKRHHTNQETGKYMCSLCGVPNRAFANYSNSTF